MTHLWEHDHPYYCTEGNYYARPSEGLHTAYDSWDAFHAEWGDLDPDLNLVFRWDWLRADPADYEDGEELPPDRLVVFWVLQRKAILRSTECVVVGGDEPAVRAWLTDRVRTIRAIWAPLLPDRAEVLREAADVADEIPARWPDMDAMKAAGVIGPHTMSTAIAEELRGMAEDAEGGAGRG